SPGRWPRPSLSLVLSEVSSCTGRHSLWALASYIPGSAHFPEFTVVLMLDDIQVGYYDSKVDRVMRASTASDHEAELNLGQEPVDVLRDIYSSMKKRLNLVKHRFNLTIDGVHVQQRVTGCEVLGDGQPALIMFRDGSNGQDADSLLYNMTSRTLSGKMLYSNIYLPFCVRTLQHLLEREKHLVMRRVKPRLRFITRRVVGGAQVTCLATDFYPRHINLSLLRDGQPVDEGELRIGSVLPNGNGLYQVRKTLMVGEKELKRKHNYTCEASHLSLDNRLRVNWRAESSYSHRVHFISPLVFLLLAAVLLLLLRRRRRRKERSEEKVSSSSSSSSSSPSSSSSV
uniref:Ig-like domain-containing protein n=1 Tax=Neolamprologus brichardi TaxID=32507 RepID=A0A3Q4MIH5_NEOBR